MPHFGNGKICYIEIPAVNVEQSAGFYHTCFGWDIRTRGDGSTAFDDAVNEVSGTWVTGRAPSHEPGMIVHIMVANIDKTIAAITAEGGAVVQPVDPASPEVYALFRDPCGNVLGVYQDPSLAAGNQP
jgi:predicted enzyme related to lactoylglutathione lyase